MEASQQGVLVGDIDDESQTVGVPREPQRGPLVLEETRDAGGLSRREIELDAGGGLRIMGHDIGASVEALWGPGLREYEFERCYSSEDTATLRSLIHLPSDADLLPAIQAHFTFTAEIEALLREQGITGGFWSRVGE